MTIHELSTLGICVEKRTWESNEPFRWLRRAPPVDPSDSGWSAGVDDAEWTWLIVSVAELIERDASVIPILIGSLGDAARRDPATGQWYAESGSS